MQNDKIAHEHVYWDQASVLAQIGLIDPASLPVVGPESARQLEAKPNGTAQHDCRRRKKRRPR